VDEDEIIRRLGGRVSCTSCESILNVGVDDRGVTVICPKCGGELVHRDDDNLEIIKNRLRVYHQSTEPVHEYYHKLGMLSDVPGSGSVKVIQLRILQILNHS
jgi:adenylate kinase